MKSIIQFLKESDTARVHRNTNYDKLNELESIFVYHRSNTWEHMENNDFRSDKMSTDSMFGKAFYFSSGYDFDSSFGRCVGGFLIRVEEPCLDLNQVIDFNLHKDLMTRINKLIKPVEPIIHEYSDDIQFGQVMSDIFYEEAHNYDDLKFDQVIKSYGCNSFKYYMDYYTDFNTQLGDYGICYGIYDPSDIKFVGRYS